jgi:hypothetical protein
LHEHDCASTQLLAGSSCWWGTEDEVAVAQQVDRIPAERHAVLPHVAFGSQAVKLQLSIYVPNCPRQRTSSGARFEIQRERPYWVIVP